MRHTLIIFFLLLSSCIYAKQDPPDSLQVSKLYSTSWVLTAKYRPSGMFKRLKKMRDPAEQRITIYANEFHTSVNNGPYQVCSSRHRNQGEFWLDCKTADQVIYRVVSIKGDELVLDMLTRPQGKMEYMRTSRNYYRRSKN